MQIETARQTLFDEDYYERGVITGKSLYSDYRWMPEATIPMAMTIVDTLGIPRGARVLDIGCAKGYLVKALRWLGRDAYGYDPSSYAIRHADSEVKGYVWTEPPNFVAEYAIAKDVLEHLTPDEVDGFLLSVLAKRLFIVVPLGDGTQYIVPANDQDTTHIIREDLSWWIHRLHQAKWKLNFARYRIPGIKDHWAQYPEGHGLLFAERR
jgi:SAM-dependent methyltransferase